MNQARQQIREERVRKAQILQASQNSGVTGSSGAIGAVGAMQTQLGTNLANASRAQQSAQGITNLNQQAANFLTSANQTQAVGGFVSSAITAGGNLYGAYQANQQLQTQQNQSIFD